MQKFIYKTIPGLEEWILLNIELEMLSSLLKIFIAGPLIRFETWQVSQLNTEFAVNKTAFPVILLNIRSFPFIRELLT